MNMVRTIVKRESWAVKVVKAIMYVITGAVFATFLKAPISDWLEMQSVVFNNDLVINIISIALGFIVAGIIIYSLKHRKDANILG